MKWMAYPLLGLLLLGACHAQPSVEQVPVRNENTRALIEGALNQIGKTVLYDPAYRQLDYPGGDVPLERGVCTDVVVRALRHAGRDLQVLVHEDMRQAFRRYPQNWGLSGPDKNIDHRRVPNLQTFFKRQHKSLPISERAADYRPGDIIAWRLPNNLLHVGVVSNHRLKGPQRFLVVHNIGAGAQLEDMLFAFEIIGHYRLF